jgi:hypothetical protein
MNSAEHSATDQLIDQVRFVFHPSAEHQGLAMQKFARQRVDLKRLKLCGVGDIDQIGIEEFVPSIESFNARSSARLRCSPAGGTDQENGFRSHGLDASDELSKPLVLWCCLKDLF